MTKYPTLNDNSKPGAVYWDESVQGIVWYSRNGMLHDIDEAQAANITAGLARQSRLIIPSHDVRAVPVKRVRQRAKKNDWRGGRGHEDLWIARYSDRQETQQ